MVPGINRAVGDQAEALALRYLQERGLTPVQKNFSCRLGELDLILRDGDCLVIAEVRCRGKRSLVSANLTVDRRKQQKIMRTAAMFLAWNDQYATMPMRFDVVGVDIDANGATSIDWISDAFRPMDARL